MSLPSWLIQILLEAASDGRVDCWQRNLENQDVEEILGLRDDQGFTPLHLAIRGLHMPLVELLLQHGADINERVNCPYETITDTPLMLACKSVGPNPENQAIAEFLLKKGAIVNDPTPNYSTALHVAAMSDMGSLVRLLIEEYGADIDAQDYAKQTPLGYVVLKGKDDAIKVLLEMGAKLDVNESCNETMLERVAKSDAVDVLEFLLQHDQNNSKILIGKVNDLLHVACQRGKTENVRVLLAHGADIESRNSENFTPLYLASKNGHETLVRFLLESSAMIDAKGSFGLQALHAAAARGSIEASTVLLEYGADINAGEGTGLTPLIVAASKDKGECVEFLLDRGANVHAKDDGGLTAVLWTCHYGKTDSFHRLLERGGTWSDQDLEGDTALHLASENGHLEMVKILVELGASVEVTNTQGITPAVKGAAHAEVVAFFGQQAKTGGPYEL